MRPWCFDSLSARRFKPWYQSWPYVPESTTREFEWREIFSRQNAVMQTSRMYSVAKLLSFPVPVHFYFRFLSNWNFRFSNSNMWRDFKFKLKVSFGILRKIMVALLTIKWLIRVEKVNWSSNHVICILVGMVVIWTSTTAMSIQFSLFIISTCSK